MNWDRLEDLIRQNWPDVPKGCGDTLRDQYRGEDGVVDNPLTEAQQKIVRDCFVAASKDHKGARDHARNFVAYALAEGWEFQIRERFKSAGNITPIVGSFWRDYDEDEQVSAVQDHRIRFIFNHLPWWSKQQKLHFLRNHDPGRLTYYAWMAYNATPQELERQDPYLSARGLLAGDERLERGFEADNRFMDFDNIEFWRHRADKTYLGPPKRRPEYVMGTPEYDERHRREEERARKLSERDAVKGS